MAKFVRQIGLGTQLKSSILDSTKKLEKELSFGSALIQVPEEMDALKTLKKGEIKSFLTLEGLTVLSNSDDCWDGEQGVSVYGDSGEDIKYGIGASIIKNKKSKYYFQTPMIYGNLNISNSKISWKIDLEEEIDHVNWYLQEMEQEMEDEEQDNKSTITLYYKWVETLKPDLFKILKELGVTEIIMDLPY